VFGVFPLTQLAGRTALQECQGRAGQTRGDPVLGVVLEDRDHQMRGGSPWPPFCMAGSVSEPPFFLEQRFIIIQKKPPFFVNGG